ncbi:MAG: 4Fe-4S binding protein [Phycisphaerae bacterium]|nr:4Fe-4S binding protein [Phycisphaerae bacterium]
MKIVTVRRISQIVFFAMSLWFGIVATVGDKFWNLRGWPVNLFLHSDPLVAVGTVLATHTLYWAFLLASGVMVVTIIFGRFFCGWVCPFGSIHHFVGWLARRKTKVKERIELNRYRKAQGIKYIILVFFLAMAAFPSAAASLQIGLLDPISLVTRSFNLLILPIADMAAGGLISAEQRFYEGAWLVLTIFAAAVLLNLFIPRFYCRFVCPLGALFGVLDRFAIWRIGNRKAECNNCKLCERSCEGGCEPAGQIKISECVLCFNCLDDCHHDLIGYRIQKSAAGEQTNPDISRRGIILSLVSGVFAVGAVRLANQLGGNGYNKLIRPPGSLPEEEFLKRCIKCGQCMRVCPTNVIQPAGFEAGLESLWTPKLNNTIGSSGCQLNCVTCGQVCPTAAIRPITLAEKRGVNEFAQKGTIRIGTAFFDRGRCLPWAMDKPCIVCEENCPVSPKAIYTREFFTTVRDGVFLIKNSGNGMITIEGKLQPQKFATGDYFCYADGHRFRIRANDENVFNLGSDFDRSLDAGSQIEVQIRLQRPYIDPDKCIGCGICEHECPVSGKKAVRVSAVGETRNREKNFLAT